MRTKQIAGKKSAHKNAACSSRNHRHQRRMRWGMDYWVASFWCPQGKAYYRRTSLKAIQQSCEDISSNWSNCRLTMECLSRFVVTWGLTERQNTITTVAYESWFDVHITSHGVVWGERSTQSSSITYQYVIPDIIKNHNSSSAKHCEDSFKITTSWFSSEYYNRSECIFTRPTNTRFGETRNLAGRRVCFARTLERYLHVLEDHIQTPGQGLPGGLYNKNPITSSILLTARIHPWLPILNHHVSKSSANV